MLRLMLVGSMFCSPVSFEATQPSTKDVSLYSSIKEECPRFHFPKTCLKSFKKIDETTYSIICTEPK